VIFPLHVTAPDGTVHAYTDPDDETGPVSTLCGLDCSEWPVLLGGEPTCAECILVRAEREALHG